MNILAENFKCPACKSVGLAEIITDKEGKAFTCECGHQEAIQWE